MRRSFNIMDIEDMYLNIIKGIYDKPTADIILIGGRLKTFPLDIQTAILYMKRCSTLLIIMYVYVKIAKLCQTLCNPMDCSLPGSSVHGIFQARMLECVAISFSRGSSQPRDQTQVSRVAGGLFTLIINEVQIKPQ